jgi:hypothetical protein
MLTRFFLVIICNFKFGFSYTIEFNNQRSSLDYYFHSI